MSRDMGQQDNRDTHRVVSDRANTYGMRASGFNSGATSSGYYQQQPYTVQSQQAPQPQTQPQQPQQPQPQWFQGPDGTQYILGPDNRLYPVAPSDAAPKPKKHKAGFWVAIILSIVCIALAAIVTFNMCTEKPKRSGELGSVAGMSEDEIRDELDKVVQAGMFDISIASMAQFEDGTSKGDLKIENPATNHYLMKVDISRDDTGEVIYSTDMIEPGYMIYSDALSKDLDAGTYQCSATFTAYDEQEIEVGKASAKTTIVVKN
ncbi:hypothetical protein [Adlercreutzia sp. ZJ154]|uniref:hypothetical protein n=1 Tax=Adlercreutzia sp. ZJ154 TaxID=2709790 RepID=UPI0013ED21A8|nr:hypothetical protein [Adlercreutzia sp. ZJ154]